MHPLQQVEWQLRLKCCQGLKSKANRVLCVRKAHQRPAPPTCLPGKRTWSLKGKREAGRANCSCGHWVESHVALLSDAAAAAFSH